jgi:hypothetical protein
MEVPKEVVQILFDTAVGSMDFGSGFLDDEEVYALRQTAELLGVDPMVATPTNYRKRMPHPYEARNSSTWVAPVNQPRGWRCKWCDSYADEDVHTEAATDADNPDRAEVA